MSDHEYWNELGNLYFMGGAYEPAIHAYLRSIQSNKKFGRSYSNLAMAFVHTGKYEEAIKFYRRSLELLPDAREKSITWNRLGILYRQMKDYKNALDAYQHADALVPQKGDDWDGTGKLPLTVSMPDVDLGSVLDGESPAKETRKAAPLERLNGILKSAQTKLANIWLDDGFVPLDQEKLLQAVNAPKAEESFYEDEGALTDEELEKIASTENISEFVQYSQTTGPLPILIVPSIDPDIAKHKAATMKNPRNLTAWESLGDAYKSSGMYKDAIHAYESAIFISPDKPDNYYYLGLTFAAERREHEAVKAFEKVLELEPNHVLAHASLGSHYRKIGKDDLAEKHLQKALNTNFENEKEYNRACLEAICGNTDRALELLKVALQTKQTFIDWVQKDPDLDCLHNDQRYQSLLSAYAASA
ncbi:MAG: tetratricopeptide repeat protein [Chloroflexi bacterium]|nr:tetratricopeptide repeat protein [Chloroflexota bacterium]